jgi:hypothetical protein
LASWADRYPHSPGQRTVSVSFDTKPAVTISIRKALRAADSLNLPQAVLRRNFSHSSWSFEPRLSTLLPWPVEISSKAPRKEGDYERGDPSADSSRRDEPMIDAKRVAFALQCRDGAYLVLILRTGGGVERRIAATDAQGLVLLPLAIIGAVYGGFCTSRVLHK